jgi:phosphoglucomutase
MGVANGVTRFWIGRDGMLSTLAVLAIVRERGPGWQTPFGAFILTASHNPGGPDKDFGIKYNTQNSGPAPEYLMQATYENTLSIQTYKICTAFPDIDISEVGSTTVGNVVVEVILSTELHAQLLKTIFDFGAIKTLLDRSDFTMIYDSMHGVNGPYSKSVFVDKLGQHKSVLTNHVPKEDFNGGHADPNLTYAKKLVAKMGLNARGDKIDVRLPVGRTIPSFGAAANPHGYHR